MTKKGKISSGFIVRSIGDFFLIVSLPYLVADPQNAITIVSFAFAGFLITIGGIMN